MIRQLLANIEPKLGKKMISFRNFILFSFVMLIGEYNELDGRMKYVGICALFCLHFQLYRIDDKRQIKLIWDIYKKV